MVKFGGNTMVAYSDTYFMGEALKEAQKAWDFDEVPVGAVIVLDRQIIARAHNATQRLCDVTAHAEIQAITAASNYMGAKYLKECTLYVTLEPCAMCAGALSWAQIDRVVYAAPDAKRGATNYRPSLYHPKTVVEQWAIDTTSETMLKEFFASKRKKGNGPRRRTT